MFKFLFKNILECKAQIFNCGVFIITNTVCIKILQNTERKTDYWYNFLMKVV